ncbi:CaiB/BaiF CoA-transferase family protein [uncultured Sneathiella sp.]|uniref:CaiB/BaiF CoA transferase family protein n=1 Tax=uncultured Sneathiella sp. TaxID=879315 RepID=UPI0025983FA3|nr:CaiB/BaiF CoA-transferase family protein [uncultured Sneathiella sp.]
MVDTPRKGPLSGLRVLDLTQFLSGPFATQIFADLGAEVIKVEGPDGDLSRSIAPHFVAGDSLYYHSINRSKDCVVLDLKTKEGQSIVRRMALASDIVIENFRPGVAARLGLSQEELRAEAPRLIWCSISGFGQDGPYRDKPAYDMIVQALSGGMSMTGEEGRPPVRAGIPIGDLAAGMYAVIACLAAVHRLDETGQGDAIDISMLDCQAAMLCYQGAYYLNSGIVPGRQGRGHDSIPTYRSFTTGSGEEVVITANTERMWSSLCAALNLSDLTADPRFTNNAKRLANREILWPILEEAFLKFTVDEAVQRLEAAEVPVGVVNTLDRVAADPQINHRGMVMTMQNDAGEQIRVMGDPIHLTSAERTAPRFPQELGADTAAVLERVLGLAPEQASKIAERALR